MLFSHEGASVIGSVVGNKDSLEFDPLDHACAQWFVGVDRSGLWRAEFRRMWHGAFEDLVSIGGGVELYGLVRIYVGSSYSGPNLCEPTLSRLERSLQSVAVQCQFVHWRKCELAHAKE